MGLTATPGDGRLCGTGRPHLVMATKDGAITAELFEDAAPKTVRELAGLIKGLRSPASDAPPAAEGAAPRPVAFDYTHPHIEIYTTPLRAGMVFKNEIDADALGLDKDRVPDAGRAMDIVQRELVPAINKVKKGGTVHPRLRDWMLKWRAAQDPSFLVGASRKDINEALGYPYTAGLASRPVAKGALTLKVERTGYANTRLGIALSDLPTRVGRQVVIGRLVSGLDLADQISIRPLSVPPGMKSLDYAPRDPVVIHSLQIQCR